MLFIDQLERIFILQKQLNRFRLFSFINYKPIAMNYILPHQLII